MRLIYNPTERKSKKITKHNFQNKLILKDKIKKKLKKIIWLLNGEIKKKFKQTKGKKTLF
jgi:hypothetical protein